MTSKISKDSAVDLRQYGSILVTCLVIAVLSVSTFASVRPTASRPKTSADSVLHQRSAKASLPEAFDQKDTEFNAESKVDLAAGSLAPPFSPSTTH